MTLMYENMPYLARAGANPRVCGLVLNVMSGKLSSVVEDQLGREVLQLLLMQGSDLQVKTCAWLPLYSNVPQVALLVEEMMTSRGGRPPLLFQLAKRESGRGILEAVRARAEKEVASRIVEILQQQLTFVPDKDGVVCQRVKDWILRFSQKN